MSQEIIQGQTLLSLLPAELRDSVRKDQDLEDAQEYCGLRLRLEDGVVQELEPVALDPAISGGLILPRLFNAHTHLGDSFIASRVPREKLPRDIMELVAPPDGLKHRLLREADEDQLASGIGNSLFTAHEQGVMGLMDFRENSLQGLEMFVSGYFKFTQKSFQAPARARPIRPVVLGRPNMEKVDPVELDRHLRRSAGLNFSSITDVGMEKARAFKEAVDVFNSAHTPVPGEPNKLLAFHASERVREDVDDIISLEPDFLVHCSVASSKDLSRLAEASVPVVVCPSSNAFFGVPLDIMRMLEHGISLGLGTDNGMLHSPSSLEELRFVLDNFNITHSQALDMALLFRELFLEPGGLRQNVAETRAERLARLRADRAAKGWLHLGAGSLMVVEGVSNLDGFQAGEHQIRLL